jgi:dihydrofolate synthase/folylpolyglutamate synthase
MTFESATTYLLGTINETVSRRSPSRLDRMRMLLRELGDPQDAYRTYHVGGTSGKGSTATMMAAALGATGKRIGLHTKPHLISMVERARVDGVPIGEETFGDVLEEMMPAIDRTAAEHGRPSYYETLLALAFVYFARERVDAAVIEVGIGGTLDGTNVIRPVVSVITNVGLDHTEILGDTIEEIARDKAGIAKPGVPLVTDANPAARAIIAEACKREGAPLVVVSEYSEVRAEQGARYGQSFELVTPLAHYALELPLLGAFQQRNAATAVTALEMGPADLLPSPADVARAFAQLTIPGRMEFFPAHPSVVFDIAHNPDKARNLASALVAAFPGRRFTFVIAIGASKDAAGVLEPFLELPAGFVFTTFDATGRTPIRPQRLAGIAEERGAFARAIADPVEALSVARRSADGASVVVVTGSTFVVATLRAWWLSNVGAVSSR